MKIKHIWEEEDIESGLYIVRDTSPIDSTNMGFKMSVMYKIGFLQESGRGGVPKRIVRVAVTDGMTIPYETRADLVTAMNEDTHGYHPATRHELEFVINKQLNSAQYVRG